MSVQTRSDPTSTQTLRDRFQAKFRSRWTDVRGDVRRELRNSSGLLSRLESDRTVATDEFRAFIDRRIEESLYEPVRPSRVRQGFHWTGPYVRDAYKAGLDRAETQLTNLEYTDDEASAATAIHADDHQAALRDEYIAVFHDTETAYWDTVTAATRAFRDDWEQSDASVSETIADVNERVEAIGRNNSESAVENRIIETYNEALLTSFERADIDVVGVIPESVDEDEADRIRDNYLERQRANASTRERVSDYVRTRLGYDSQFRVHAVGELQFTTAGDERVCPECSLYGGQHFRISDIRAGNAPKPPLHPNCRCMLMATAMSRDDEDYFAPDLGAREFDD